MRAQHQSGTARVAAHIVILSFLGLTLLAAVPAQGVASRSPLYIGEVTSLTGVEAYSGGPTTHDRIGAQLAISEINAGGGIGGRRLQLVLADGQSTADGAAAAFQRLARNSKIVAIIAPNFSYEDQAMMPFIKLTGLPVMIRGTAAILTHEGNPWVFRTRVNASYSARALIAFTVTTLHLTKIALLYENDVAGREQDVLWRAELGALGVTPVTDQAFTPHAADMTAHVLAIKKAGATALVSSATNPEDYLLLARQMRQLGIHLTWVGNSILALTAVLRYKGSALLYGTYSVTDYAAGQSPEATAFDQSCRATFHLRATFTGASAYDAVRILALVMRRVGTAPAAIRRGILAIHGYRGVMGTFNFDRNGDGLHQETIVQNVEGRLRVVKVLVF